MNPNKSRTTRHFSFGHATRFIRSLSGNFFGRFTIATGILLILGRSGMIAAAPEKMLPVVAAAAKLEIPIEEIPLPGSAFPWKESSLSTQVDGLVLEVLVDDGDPVKKGQPLIRLDDTIADLTTRQAKAALEESEAAYEESLRKLAEAAKLVEKRHVAETTYESLIAESKMKKAVRERLTAEYRRARELAGRYRLLAPFDGIVGTVAVEVGQWIESGDTLINLFDIETLKIRVQVPQRYYSAIDAGTPVSIRFDALTGQRFEAVVSRKIPIGTTDARTFPVRIDLPNPGYRISPGMSAKILFRIHEADHTPVLTVPQDALVTAPDGSESVWKVAGEEKGFVVNPVAVTTGRHFDGSVEITAGSIGAGDRLVVRGNEILKSGQQVHLLDQAAD